MKIHLKPFIRGYLTEQTTTQEGVRIAALLKPEASTPLILLSRSGPIIAHIVQVFQIK